MLLSVGDEPIEGAVCLGVVARFLFLVTGGGG